MKLSYTFYTQSIIKLFKTILASGKSIGTSNTSIRSPIHKKALKIDPGNYRAIFLSCCMSKFFAAVLNQRFLKIASGYGIIAENHLC